MNVLTQVQHEDVLRALDQVEQQCGAETANLLRAVYSSLSFIVEMESDATDAPMAISIRTDGWYAGR